MTSSNPVRRIASALTVVLAVASVGMSAAAADGKRIEFSTKSQQAKEYVAQIVAKIESFQLGPDVNALARKANQKEVISLARQATQFSEDARALTAERQEEERIAADRAAAAANAKAEAEAEQSSTSNPQPARKPNGDDVYVACTEKKTFVRVTE